MVDIEKSLCQYEESGETKSKKIWKRSFCGVARMSSEAENWLERIIDSYSKLKAFEGLWTC